MKKKRIKVPLFNGKVELIIAKPGKKIEKYLDYKIGYFYASTLNWTANDDSNQIVHIIFTSKQEITAGVVAHEASHAVAAIFKRQGVDLDPNGETFCYTLEWLVDEIMLFFKENKYKLK